MYQSSGVGVFRIRYALFVPSVHRHIECLTRILAHQHLVADHAKLRVNVKQILPLTTCWDAGVTVADEHVADNAGADGITIDGLNSEDVLVVGGSC